jgi:hypothetical protein
MKRGTKWFLLLSLLLSFLFSSGAMQKTEGHGGQSGFCDRLKPCQLLSHADAEKILGQSVRLTKDISELRGDVRQCSCVYTAVFKDKASGQDTNLFFAVEQTEPNPSEEQSRQTMKSTRDANSPNIAIIDLSGIGDEAYLLGDQPNIHFIMARKGVVVIRLQIKEATEQPSLERLKAFAREVTKRL